jgi:probable rRNA maturation factor
VLAGEEVARAEIGLALGDDGTLRQLNRMYRGIDRTTDVLSFTYEDRRDARGTRELWGDLVVSVPRVRVQARRYRVSAGRELARLLTHGALHLCGLDHRRAAERADMRSRERRHLRGLTALQERALTRLVRAWTADAG